MLTMGLTGWCLCTKKMKGSCCCIGTFEICQLILLILTLILAIFPLAIYFISEDDINWFCDNNVEHISATFEYTDDRDDLNHLIDAK